MCVCVCVCVCVEKKKAQDDYSKPQQRVVLAAQILSDPVVGVCILLQLLIGFLTLLKGAGCKRPLMSTSLLWALGFFWVLGLGFWV